MVDWVNVPVLRRGQTLLSTDVRVKLRVSKPYSLNTATGVNGGVPMFTFNDKSVIQSATNDDALNKKLALDLINIVPNPYYAYSSYEPNRNDYRVRFTNLPANASITVYTSNGILVRISCTKPLRTSPLLRNKPTLPPSRASPITFHAPASSSDCINSIH